MQYYPVLKLHGAFLGWGFELTTPDFNVTNPVFRPRLVPRLAHFDCGSYSECKWMTTLTWFFHLTFFYGKPDPDPPSEYGVG